MLGPAEGKARAWLHQNGEVLTETQNEDGATTLAVRVSSERLGQFRAEFPELAASVSLG
jgi:GTP-binding protein HflX